MNKVELIEVWSRSSFGAPIKLSSDLSNLADKPYAIDLSSARDVEKVDGDVFLENMYSLGLSCPAMNHFEEYFEDGEFTEHQMDYIRSMYFYGHPVPLNEKWGKTYDAVTTGDVIRATLAMGKGIWNGNIGSDNRLKTIPDFHLWGYQDSEELTRLRFSMAFGTPITISLGSRLSNDEHEPAVTVGEVAHVASRYPKFFRDYRDFRNYVGWNLRGMSRRIFGESWMSWIGASLVGGNTMIAPWVSTMKDFPLEFDAVSDLLCRGIYKPELLILGAAEDIDSELLRSMQDAA